MNNTTASYTPLLPVHIPGLRFLIAFTCILIYLFGYTGCFLSILTFSSKKLRRHSTGFLFLIMAFVDILNLFASLQYFLDVIYQINVFAMSIHWCRFFTMYVDLSFIGHFLCFSFLLLLLVASIMNSILVSLGFSSLFPSIVGLKSNGQLKVNDYAPVRTFSISVY